MGAEDELSTFWNVILEVRGSDMIGVSARCHALATL